MAIREEYVLIQMSMSSKVSDEVRGSIEWALRTLADQEIEIEALHRIMETQNETKNNE